MKKLLALLVIIIFTTSIVIAVENPFSFSLYNQIKLKAVDTSQPGLMQDAQDANGYSPTTDFNVTKANLNDEMKCSASITIAEIYTLGSYLKGVGEYGFGGDANRTAFEVGMTNAIQVVPDYLKIDINAAWEIRWESRQTTSTTSWLFDEGFNPDGTAKVAPLDLNGDGDTTDVLLIVTENDTAEIAQHVQFLLKPSFAIGGSIPDTGFSWKIAEDIEMEFNPENWKDTDPTYESWDGDAYNSLTGLLITDGTGAANAPGLQEGAFQSAEFKTNLTLTWEFFHFFAPENITCTLKLSQNVNVLVPYSYYLEEDKRLRTEGEYGVDFGLAGVNFGIFLHYRTDDFLNTSAPLNGDFGSNRSWDGTWIGNVGNKDDTIDVFGTTTAAWAGDFDDIDAVSHARPDMRIGPKITFGYSKEWFSFGTTYTGFLDGIRVWDEDGLNEDTIWNNEFEIYAKFSL